jgi:hypothetical protein
VFRGGGAACGAPERVVGRRGRVGAGWPAARTPWCDGSGQAE